MASAELAQLVARLRATKISGDQPIDQMRVSWDKFATAFPPAPDLSFAAVRVVIDPAYRPLPQAALVGMRSDGKADVWAVARSLLRQPRQIVRQRRERIARQIESFQRIGKIENLAWKLSQTAGQFKSPRIGQLSGAQLFEGGHHGRMEAIRE